MDHIVTLELGAHPKRRIARTRTVGVRVTEAEYVALEQNAWKAGKTLADWVRDQILGPAAGEIIGGNEHIFTELVGIELILMNAFPPLLRGEQVSQEHIDAVWRKVQSIKRKKAQELLTKRASADQSHV